MKKRGVIFAAAALVIIAVITIVAVRLAKKKENEIVMKRFISYANFYQLSIDWQHNMLKEIVISEDGSEYTFTNKADIDEIVGVFRRTSLKPVYVAKEDEKPIPDKETEGAVYVRIKYKDDRTEWLICLDDSSLEGDLVIVVDDGSYQIRGYYNAVEPVADEIRAIADGRQ